MNGEEEHSESPVDETSQGFSLADGFFSLEPRPTVVEQRERTASRLAYFLVAILAMTIVLIFIEAWVDAVDGATQLAEILIPAITTLVASVVSFYYGTRKDNGT
jgi:hypothetical protein